MAPDTMDSVFRFSSAPDVPTLTSTTAVVPSLWKILANDAVPVASADESEVIELAVQTPLAADAAEVALSVRLARSVLPLNAVLALVGLVPL